MGRRKTVLLALVFSLFSLTVVYGAEGKLAAKPQYVKFAVEAESPEELYGEYIPVLMYHHFASRDMESGNGMVATVTELEDHLRYFKSQGYQIITLEKLDTLLRRVENNHSMTGKGLGFQEKYICITMDDGYYSNYELAYPLFKKYRTPASVFAVTDFVTEQYGLKKFSWKQAKEMDESGWLKVYSHSADHIPVKDGQEEEFLACMQKSESTLTENLEEKRVKAMAYPNGQYTEKSQELLEDDGYVLQFTIEKGVITRETARNAIPRITVESGMTGRDLVRVIELAAEKTFAA
ncbi:MAG: polysaccharide deacetylase family protein, partial [Anaerotignum sp.]|nr:polysaccharide deacetylase family protein [Anaerotignum sp.]